MFDDERNPCDDLRFVQRLTDTFDEMRELKIEAGQMPPESITIYTNDDGSYRVEVRYQKWQSTSN